MKIYLFFSILYFGLQAPSLSHGRPAIYDRNLLDSHPQLVIKTNNFDKDGKDPLTKIEPDGRKNSFGTIGRILPRQEIPWKLPNEQMIKTKDMESTGFLISPCLIMANYHSVFGTSKSPNTKDFSVTFIANREAIAHPVVWGDYDVQKEISNDWVLLKLEKNNCLGLEVGWLTYAPLDRDKYTSTEFLTAGFAGRKVQALNPNQLWGDLDCRIYALGTGLHRDTLFNDCALNAGQSGSPILFRAPNGDLQFVGMQSSDFEKTTKFLRKYSVKHANVAVDMLPVLAFGVVQLIRKDLIENNIIKPN